MKHGAFADVRRADVNDTEEDANVAKREGHANAEGQDAHDEAGTETETETSSVISIVPVSNASNSDMESIKSYGVASSDMPYVEANAGTCVYLSFDRIWHPKEFVMSRFLAVLPFLPFLPFLPWALLPVLPVLQTLPFRFLPMALLPFIPSILSIFTSFCVICIGFTGCPWRENALAFILAIISSLPISWVLCGTLYWKPSITILPILEYLYYAPQMFLPAGFVPSLATTASFASMSLSIYVIRRLPPVSWKEHAYAIISSVLTVTFLVEPILFMARHVSSWTLTSGPYV